MCGISGIVGEQPHVIEKMVAAQRHRGPDAEGIYRSEACSLGHNRLSIIDLTAAANQPFGDPSGRFMMVFNGEIYNYKELKEALRPYYEFLTDSDTEVLLAGFRHYGPSVLHKLNGMFAIAIWDTVNQTLWAARDRFGVKPFYYAVFNGRLYFASEIKALHAAGVPRRPSEEVWASHFVYGTYGNTIDTFWEDVRELPAGHILRWDTSHKLSISRWYDFTKAVTGQPSFRDKNEVKDYYRALLLDSISLRFRADVPVGFNVSGGVDSSLLLALIDKNAHHSGVNAFTFYTGDPNYDELPWVERLIGQTGHPLHKVRLEADAVPSLSSKIAYNQDEPYGGIPTLAYARVFQEARKEGCIVLLDGQGMDEQWAGYDYYRQDTGALVQGVRTSPFRPGMLTGRFKENAHQPQYDNHFGSRVKDLQHRDIFYTKLPRALRFNDRVSMASGIELREPFLDYRMVEFAFSQPDAYKIEGSQGKMLLRELTSEILGTELALAPKRPLQTPQREWLAGPLQSFVRKAFSGLLESTCGAWFDHRQVRSEVDRYFEGDQESSFHIWQLVNCYLLLGES